MITKQQLEKIIKIIHEHMDAILLIEKKEGP